MKATLAILLLSLVSVLPVRADDAYDKALQAYSCVDYAKAIRLFQANAEKGHGLSQYMMGMMLEHGQGAETNVAAALDWYRKAARQGIADAYYALGDMYGRGVGVARDTVQSFAWYDLAARGGHTLAKEMLEADAAKLQPAQLDQARKWVSDWLEKLGR